MIQLEIEGGAIGFLGGIIGVGLGFILGRLLNLIGSQTFLSDFPTFQLPVFPYWLFFGVIGITTAISLLAGLYPGSMPVDLRPRIIMLTAIAASKRLNTLETALSPPWPINLAICSLDRKIAQAITIFKAKDSKTI